MRMLSGEEAPDAGERIEGHNVVMQYFAQDEATRLDPAPTVYETLAVRIADCTWCRRSATSSAASCSRATTSTSSVRVLSGGERTRLAVARMLLRPSNTLLLDEPTNHLDLDSKDVLLDALVDYGGTLIFVSHDRYFVERLATKIIEVGHGDGARLSRAPTRSSSGTRSTREAPEPAARATGRRQADAQPDGRSHAGAQADKARTAGSRPKPRRHAEQPAPAADTSRDEKKRADAEARKKRDARAQARRRGSTTLEARIADTRSARSASSKQQMAAPGFYDDRAAAQPVIDRHQALMWEVGDLMHQWEELQAARRPRQPDATDEIVIAITILLSSDGSCFA